MISRRGEEAFGSGRSIQSVSSAGGDGVLQQIYFRDMADIPMPADSPCPRPMSPICARSLDEFARERLTLADFDPVLDFDAELIWATSLRDLYQALRVAGTLWGGESGAGVLPRASAQLTAPPRILKEKHVKLKLRAGGAGNICGIRYPKIRGNFPLPQFSRRRRCHPDRSAIRRSENRGNGR